MPIAHIAPRSRAVPGLLVLAAVLLLPLSGRAEAEDTAAIDKVTKMNKKAVEEYENLNFEEARKILKDALDLCSQSGLDKHPIRARTHIHLGVVILAGFKQRELAIKQFRKALEIQPDIKLTKSLANPEVQEAFDEAVAGMGKAEPPPPPTDKPDTGEKPGNGEPLSHEPITRAVQGRVIAIKATVDPSLGAKKVVLAYRPEGAADFLGRDMKEASPGNWVGEIPASATAGERVTYYVDAQDEEGESLASKGSATEPLAVVLRTGGAKEPAEPGDEDEVDRRWFVGLGFGGGIGWATGNGEVNADHMIKPPGFAPSSLGHVAPELGYFWTQHLMLSLQVRFQYITGPTSEAITDPARGCGTDKICSPATYALAGFVKAAWLFGESSFHPYVSGSVGGGYIRHVAEFPAVGKICGPPANNQTCVDTVAAGPVLLGPGAGFFYNVTPGFALALGVNTYLGFPNFTFHVDANAGVAFEF